MRGFLYLIILIGMFPHSNLFSRIVVRKILSLQLPQALYGLCLVSSSVAPDSVTSQTVSYDISFTTSYIIVMDSFALERLYLLAYIYFESFSLYYCHSATLLKWHIIDIQYIMNVNYFGPSNTTTDNKLTIINVFADFWSLITVM